MPPCKVEVEVEVDIHQGQLMRNQFFLSMMQVDYFEDIKYNN